MPKAFSSGCWASEPPDRQSPSALVPYFAGLAAVLSFYDAFRRLSLDDLDGPQFGRDVRRGGGTDRCRPPSLRSLGSAPLAVCRRAILVLHGKSSLYKRAVLSVNAITARLRASLACCCPHRRLDESCAAASAPSLLRSLSLPRRRPRRLTAQNGNRFGTLSDGSTRIGLEQQCSSINPPLGMANGPSQRCSILEEGGVVGEHMRQWRQLYALAITLRCNFMPPAICRDESPFPLPCGCSGSTREISTIGSWPEAACPA